MGVRYRTVEEMPVWAREGMQELIDIGAIRGREDGNLDLSDDMMRILLAVRNMLDVKGMLDSSRATACTA